MKNAPFIAGEMRQYDAPNWGPLEAFIGIELCSHFMWMHDVELEDGTLLNAYKHRWTRAYFHLSEDGRTFYYKSEKLYREFDRRAAIRAVFEGWECCEPTPDEKKALRAALRRAGTRPSAEDDRHG